MERLFAGGIELREGDVQYVVSPNEVGSGKVEDERVPSIFQSVWAARAAAAATDG